MQCWTDLVPLLGGNAQFHAAIVAMHIPLLGTTSFAKQQGPSNQQGDQSQPLHTVG